MTTPESGTPINPFELLSAEIDQYRYRSDPYHVDMREYDQIVQMGEVVLPDLLAGSANMGLWRLEAIIKIAEDIGRPISLPTENIPVYQDYVDSVLSWGGQNGYLPDQPAGNV